MKEERLRRGILIGKFNIFLMKTYRYAPTGHGGDKFVQILHVARQSVEAVDVQDIAFTQTGKTFRQTFARAGRTALSA